MEKRVFKPKDFSKLISVSVRTLQQWDRDGILKAKRTPTNRRYYIYEQYLDLLHLDKKKKTVVYARVSSNNQKDDLENQIEFLKQFANASGMIVDEIMVDIGSGLNYNRKNWNSLIDKCVSGEIENVIISHKDRFVRFGYEWFENFLSSVGTKITVVNNEKSSPEKELVDDLISIIHVFSCRVYGLKKYKQKLAEDKEIDSKL